MSALCATISRRTASHHRHGRWRSQSTREVGNAPVLSNLVFLVALESHQRQSDIVLFVALLAVDVLVMNTGSEPPPTKWTLAIDWPPG